MRSSNPAANALGLGRLQLGERAAILLAESVNADLALLHEKAARLVAAKRGLRVTGVAGVLAEAADLGLADLPATVDRLTQVSGRPRSAVRRWLGEAGR